LDKLRQTLRVRKERAILVAAVADAAGDSDGLTELTALAESAGAIVVDTFQQKVRTIKPATYIGKGKALQLGQRVKRFKADVVIFDNDLSPRQIVKNACRLPTVHLCSHLSEPPLARRASLEVRKDSLSLCS